MAQKSIVQNGSFVPTKEEMKRVDDNFDELYASKSSVESDVTDLQAGQGIVLTEYADNAAALTGGLEAGDLYSTEGAVKVVTAAE